jgi:hypothetical protein
MKPVKHFLVSMKTRDGGMVAHCYVMTSGREDIPGIADMLIGKMREFGLNPLEIILATDLSGKDCEDARNFVRKYFADNCLEAKELMQKATDFHCSAAIVPAVDPINADLMKMH